MRSPTRCLRILTTLSVMSCFQRLLVVNKRFVILPASSNRPVQPTGEPFKQAAVVLQRALSARSDRLGGHPRVPQQQRRLPAGYRRRSSIYRNVQVVRGAQRPGVTTGFVRYDNALLPETTFEVFAQSSIANSKSLPRGLMMTLTIDTSNSDSVRVIDQLIAMVATIQFQ